MTEPSSEVFEEARSAVADAGLSLRGLRHVPAGRAHHVFEAECESGNFFVKVSGSPRPRLANERRALGVVATLEIPVPEVVFATDRVLVTRSLGDGLRPIGGDDRDAWRALGRSLRALHQVDPSGFGLRYDTDPLSLAERLTKSARGAVTKEGLEIADMDERLEKLRAACDETPIALTHRDLRWDNVLVTADGNLAGIVDFEHAAGARAGWDFVKLLSWRRPSNHCVAAFEEAYGPLPNYEVWEWFEAVMLLAHPLEDIAYTTWAKAVLDRTRTS